MKHLRIALFPLAAVAFVVLAVLAPSSSDTSRAPSRVTVTDSAYACPAGSVITIAAGQVRAGSASVADVFPDRSRDRDLEDAGAWRTSVADGAGARVRQEGEGSGAVGFFAGTAPRGGGGGLVVGSCAGVVDDAWLMGLGSGGKHFSTLILTNLADSPAAVDVTLWGTEGRVDAVGAEGIVVKPSSVRRIRLDELAAGEAELAIRVHRRRGSVSAVVNDTSTSVFRGTEPVSPTLSPRRSQIIGGLTDDAEGRTLLLLNPGKTTARVGVQVLGPDGTFEPSGLGRVKVPAGSIRSVEIPRSAGADEQALKITSDHPVAATVRMAPTKKDFAYAEAVPPLTGPAVVPVDLGDADSGVPRLVLTAPGAAATVDVRAYDAAMKPLMDSSVKIKAGTTTSLALKLKGAAYLIVRPRGTVVAAATYSDGDLVSSLALTTAPVTVLAPQVRPAP